MQLPLRRCAVSILLLICWFSVRSEAQVLTGFTRNDNIPVSAASVPLPLAWAGGMNFLQYSEIDLDFDGIKDLFVFDRSGNKITTYLNTGTANQVSYVLAPQYVYRFPVLRDWVLLRDYNCDGKEDIFTSTVAGFSVYRNISTVSSGIQFQLEESLVLTNRSPNSSNFMGNLYVSTIDIPAIRDIDGDSDLDVLTFSNGGTQVEYHRNMSMERYGICDSIEYIVSTNCWGVFSENISNASVSLNQSCLPVPIAEMQEQTRNGERHSGSCLECINVDGDSLTDVVMGDVGSPNMMMLHNGGTVNSALIDSFDAAYPSNSVSVNTPIFMCPSHIDVNNDGKRDLLFSPAAPGASENTFSSHYYLNSGADDSVVSTFVQNDFLQEHMIDVGEGAYPVLFDFDDDGDKDLLIGNYGYFAPSGLYRSKIALYTNTGSPSAPQFSFTTDDFANLFSLQINYQCMIPTFWDLDNDGDEDMLIGDLAGNIHYYKKGNGGPQDFTLFAANFGGIDAGDYAAPDLSDVNRDGKPDLLVGSMNGRVKYYENTGTIGNPVFTLNNATFGGIDVRQPGWFSGYSTPRMTDQNGNYTMVVGSERGWIYRYDNIDGNLGGTFTLTDSMYISWREGGRTCCAIGDLNNDGLYDAVIGNYAGGVSLFYGDNNVSTANNVSGTLTAFNVYPNPATESFTIEISGSYTAEYVTVTDQCGRIVIEESMFTGKKSINCSMLSTGMYYCTLTYTDGSRFARKIIIQ
jgi:hypothetical protein